MADIITIADVFDVLNNLDSESECEGAVKDTEDSYKDLQRDQLLHGFKGDGARIGRYRNRQYAREKNFLNPLAGLGYVDLKLTGAVHRDLQLQVQSGELIIESTDPKMPGLIEKYDDPLGLTEENDDKYIDEALDEAFVKRIENKTGL